ncbi:fimbria/pilus outer membrane usher protein [Novosphingobium panipatense]|uniref:Outer membrane usher protein n=1 Tax=Novosphingobium panipatense TaxID=428991 RepID=A0ABY1Q6T9_9SPHN|nr:fimbria/pilus outer membrane usher protein [Novosphingobium panipatense]SMP61468.1 outer membrane usher protein [Novosphingobium panipatense]
MVAIAGVSWVPSPVNAQSSPQTPVTLVLEVRVNGVRSPLLWEFVQLPDGALAATAERLQGLGLKVPPARPPADLVRLDDLPGITYRYIEAAQAVEIDATDAAVVPMVLDAGIAPREIDLDKVTRNTGALLNYGVYADIGKDSQASAQYDLRILTRRGVLSTTGFATLADDGNGGVDHTRLDTYWRIVDVRTAIALTLGDTIGSGGGIASAYRLAGIQIQRDFESRPDLVTMALPTLNGTAAVPSTVDLYINGLRYFTGTVGRGPFQFRSLPNIGGGATATVVLTDATGRETRLSKPLFFAPDLLPQGRLDFSVEAGFPRLNYGSESFDYLSRFSGSASVRYGVSDALTLRAHVEGMRGHVMGSLGGTVRLGGFGAISAGASVSRFRERTGRRFVLEGQAHVLGIDFFGGIERSNSRYQTLVGATSFHATRRADPLGAVHPGLPTDPLPTPDDDPLLVAFARKIDRFGASFSIADIGINLAYTHVELANQQFRAANFSAQRSLGTNLSLWVNGFRDFTDRKDYGVAVGLTVALGRRSTAAANVAHSRDATRISSRFTYNSGYGEGSWNVNLASQEVVSGTGTDYRAADVRYRGHHATLGGGVDNFDGETRVNGFIQGSIVAMGGLFLAPTVDRSFAVVRGGGPNTPLLVDSREVGHTDAHGRALLPSLRSLATNRIEIDPTSLPLDMSAPQTEIEVVPDDRAGVIVDFGVRPQAAAVIILVDGASQPLAVGALVTIEDGGGPTVVGHDGRVFLTGLAAHNRILVELPEGGECRASFDFVPVVGGLPQIGPVTCQ